MNDINQPITNPKLLNAIEKIEIDEKLFVNELRKAKLLCPVILKGQNEMESVSDNEYAIQFLGLCNEDDDKFLMAFTDWNQLYKWNNQENQQTVIFEVEDYKKIVFQENSLYDGLVINPCEQNIQISKQALI